MQEKKLFAIASCLSVLGLFAASCATAAAPTPTFKAPGALSGSESPVAEPRSTIALTATPKAEAERPKYGGVLRIGNQGDPPSFDPHLESSLVALGPFATCYNGLVQNDPKNPAQIAPDLAEKWDVSPDGKGFTFHLRQGVLFHDGKPLTAADARSSLERVTAKSPRISSILSQVIVKVEDPEPTSLRVTLKYPYPPILKYLALGLVAIVPKQILDTKGDVKRDAIGTGPFKFSRHNQGTSVDFVKNERYYIKERPYMDGISFYPIKDAFTRLAAFRTTRINLIYPTALSAEHATLLTKEMPTAMVQQYEGGNWWSFYMNLERKPWDDIRVRKAVHLALDRQQAMSVVDPGAASLFGFIPPHLGGIPEDQLMKLPGWRQPKEQDRAEAKKLLAEAGYPEGFKTSLLTRMGRDWENFSTFMADQLRTIGISAELDVKETGAFYDAEFKRTFHAHPQRQGMDVQDVDNILPVTYKTGSAKNFSGFSNKEIDDLIDKQSQTADPEKRKQIVAEIEQKLIELQPAVVSHWSGYWITWSSNVKGFVRTQGIYDSMRHTETWLS